MSNTAQSPDCGGLKDIVEQAIHKKGPAIQLPSDTDICGYPPMNFAVHLVDNLIKKGIPREPENLIPIMFLTTGESSLIAI